MRKLFSILLLFFLFQFGISEKTIQIKSVLSKECKVNDQQFRVIFEATYTDITESDQINLPLKEPNNVHLLCTPSPSQYPLYCSLNIIIHPIFNEKVTLDTSVTTVSGIKIIWSLQDPTIYQDNCSPNYTHKFKVENHTEVIKCQDENNVIDIFGTYESLTNNDLISILSEGTQISFFIDIGNDYVNSICFLYENEGKMTCMIKGKGKALFYKTTADGRSETPVVLMEQSFEMQLKDCSSNSKSKFIKFSLLGLLFIILL